MIRRPVGAAHDEGHNPWARSRRTRSERRPRSPEDDEKWASPLWYTSRNELDPPDCLTMRTRFLPGICAGWQSRDSVALATNTPGAPWRPQQPMTAPRGLPPVQIEYRSRYREARHENHNDDQNRRPRTYPTPGCRGRGRHVAPGPRLRITGPEYVLRVFALRQGFRPNLPHRRRRWRTGRFRPRLPPPARPGHRLCVAGG